MVEYLEKFPPFGIDQDAASRECQKELIVQDFDSATQGLAEIAEFCKPLENAKENFYIQGEGKHQNKKQAVCWTTPTHQVVT